MKHFLIILYLFLNSLVFAQDEASFNHAQGTGYYPITVSVTNATTDKPLAKARARIELDKRLLLSAGRQPNTLKEPYQTIDKNFHKIQTTNDFGLVSLFYIAKWSEYGTGALFVYRRGVLIIELEGYLTQKINLADIKTSDGFSHSGVTHLEIKLEK